MSDYLNHPANRSERRLRDRVLGRFPAIKQGDTIIGIVREPTKAEFPNDMEEY